MHVWPTDIRDAILDRVGPNPEISSLGGMSGSAVLRVRDGGRSAVLKHGRSPVETHVYSELSERLRAAGIGLPELYAVHQDGDTYWLLIEDIPNPLPRDRWMADPDQLTMLRGLHAIPKGDVSLHLAAYRPDSPVDLTVSMLSLFDECERNAIRQRLDFVRVAVLELFEPRCLISGDPNPANWGVRDDGSLVLFDWERCSFGTPALDLAITAPGLGTEADLTSVARAYLLDAPDETTRRLALEIVTAKVWSVTEFVGYYARGEFTPAFDMQPLIASYPAWLGAVTAGSRFG